jgi:ZIP family zinc transporter
MIIVLGAFAGLTIYLGLPVACLPRLSRSAKVFLSMLATGILIFLLYDVLSKASEPIGAAIAQVREQRNGQGTLFADVLLLVLGLGIGLIGLVYFNTHITSRLRLFQPRDDARGGGGRAAPVVTPAPMALASVGAARLSPSDGSAVLVQPVAGASIVAERELSPRMLALIIATGIGLHNFSEGLAIGQSAASGALQLAAVLIIGFGLHNMSEGFGIAGPLTGQPVSWKLIGLLGLIGGGPTFLGTVVGIVFHSPQLFIFCLALAAGAIIYVVAELLGVAKRFKSQNIVMWGLLLGFLLGYMTDLIVTFAGA